MRYPQSAISRSFPRKRTEPSWLRQSNLQATWKVATQASCSPPPHPPPLPVLTHLDATSDRAVLGTEAPPLQRPPQPPPLSPSVDSTVGIDPLITVLIKGLLLGDFRARDLPERGRDRPAQRRARFPLASFVVVFLV
jgi:hypothetical protein